MDQPPKIQQDVKGDHNIVAGSGDVHVHIDSRQEKFNSEHQAGLSILRDRVKQFWIDGVLKNSLYHEVLISLEKEAMADAVENPWERELALPDNSKCPILKDKKTIDIFRETGRFLLLLGEPGSGKTTTLLELASHLLSQVEKNPQEPIPVIFNLSTWTDNNLSLFEWLIKELKSKYKVGGKLARSWIEQYQIMPLLDGLDEVKSENLTHCVEAINEYITNSDYGTPGVVVCCRLREYSSLSVRLKLNGAICVRPLKFEQVTQYFDQLGPKLDVLKTAVTENQALKKLSTSPLMLGLMSLVYQDLQLETIIGDEKDSVEKRSKDLFELYIERMFERKGKKKLPYSKKKMKGWLSLLAQKMRAHSQSVFLIENLQPTWLSNRILKAVYDFTCGTIVGLCSMVVLEIGVRPRGSGSFMGFFFWNRCWFNYHGFGLFSARQSKFVL